jgi:hypothetical protein
MKHIITLAFFVIIFSCVANRKVENERISKFEDSLGKSETKYLNKLVNDFDSFLAKKYNGKEYDSNFKEYLNEISESNHPDIWKIDKNKLVEIQETNLLAKYDSIFPDSVWYNENVINVSFSSLGITNSIALIQKGNQEFNVDSLINVIKAKPRLEEIEPSKFQIALTAVMTDDILIQNYLDAKRAAGTISIRLIADGLRYNYRPNEEYFAKRIMIMEMND